MRKFQIFSLLVIFTIVAVLVAGCGGNKEQTAQSGGDSGSSGEAAETKEKITMMIGHATAPGNPRDMSTQEFAKVINEKTNGQVEVEVYPASQLGSNAAMLESVLQGAIQAIIVPTAFTAKVTTAFELMDLPFLFPDMHKSVEFMIGPEAKELMKVVESKGYKAIAFWPSDMKLMTGPKPIEKLEDLKGLKFRVMSGDVLMDTYNSWGASAIPLQLNELYTALSQKTVDAQENTLGTIYDFKFYEVQKYIIESNHSLTADVFLINKSWFESLPADLQKMMEDEAVRLASVRKDMELDRNSELRKELKEKGVEFVEISAEEKQRMREAAQSAYDNYIKANPDMQTILDAIVQKYN